MFPSANTFLDSNGNCNSIIISSPVDLVESNAVLFEHTFPISCTAFTLCDAFSQCHASCWGVSTVSGGLQLRIKKL